MYEIVLSVNSTGEVYFRRSGIFDKITVAIALAGLRGELWFVHNGVTLRANASTKPEHLFCAWLDTWRTGVTDIGPDFDYLVVERFVQIIKQLRE